MNENIQLNISRLQTYFEELEKRIKSVERQITTTNQVSAIQSCLAEIKEVLLEYQSTYTELVNEYNTHKQDYDQKVSTNTTEHSTFSSSISSLNANVLTLQNNVQDLQSKVTLLENSSGTGSGSGCLCKNTSDFCHNYINCHIYYNQFYSPKFLLLANQNQYIDIKLKVKIKSSQALENSNYTITLNCNEKNVISKSYIYNTETETKEITYRYYPTQNSNTIRFFIIGSNILFLYDYIIEVNGRDVMLDAKTSAINIRCFNDKYYIVKWDNDSGILYYDIQDKENLSLSEQNMQINYLTNTINYAFLDCTLVPALKEATVYTSDAETSFPNGIKIMLQTQKENHGAMCLNYSTTELKLVQKYVASLYANKLSFAPCCNNYGDMIYAYTNKTNQAYVKGDLNTAKCINDATYESFYNACIVQYNYAKIGESVKPYAGSLFQRSDGMWIYYPTLDNKSADNSTRTEIAIGNNCTAYLQTDGTINVYINVGLKVYKYTLTKNTTTNKYDLNTSYSVINGVTKYEELLDGKALAHTYDTYEIVDM